jgi:PAS domain S-box-containing protein
MGGHNLKRLKDSLAETDVELQILLDALPFYVMLLDEDHKILLANKAVRGDLGLVPEHIVGKYCPEVIHGLKEPYPGCPLEEAIEKNHGIEREFFDPDENRWINSAIYPTIKRTQDGKDIFIHFINDISEKKQAAIEIEQNYEIQSVINSVLRLSLEDIPLNEILKRVIDLILSIPWLAFNSKASVFIVKEKSEMLVMESQSGLPKTTQMECAQIPFGKCLCGQAALVKEIQIADYIDDHNQILCSGNTSHDQYCVPILFDGNTLGVINVHMKEGYRHDEKIEQFLKAISDTLAGVIIRKQTDQELNRHKAELENKNKDLEEMNSALNVLLKKRDEDRKKLEENVLFNAKKLLMPYIDKLKNSNSNNRQARFVNILESNLNNIISPFAQTLSHKHFNLTPLEIQIADHIKQGKSTKEIADIFSLSIRTIEFHRQNIRKKLGLKNKKSNLRTHLLSIQ